MRNIILDGQILQTDAWYRGMGRYTLQLAQHLSDRQDSDYKIYIAFNDNLKCDSQRFKVIKYLCPSAEQIHTPLPVPADRSTSEKSYKQPLNRLMTERFAGQDNYYVITSLFTFSFYAQYPENCHKILLFYDLTPLLFWKDLGGYFPPHLYMRRFRQIYEADVITTISATVRDDVVNIFGLDSGKVININGGFTKPTNKSQKPKLKDIKDYILFVSGDLPHKNNRFAVKGFADFKKSSGKDVDLIVTSTFSEQSRERLSQIYPDIIFSGNVSDEELEWFYQRAAAVMFASKYEGLGIPILDAVFNNKPVLASSIPVFKEMTENGFYFFSTEDPGELEAAIRDALSGRGFSEKKKSYPGLLKKYSWENTADDFLQAVYGTRIAPIAKAKSPKKRIAMVAVNPGIPCQIGRLAEPLHYWLSQNYEVDYFFDSTGLNITQMERPTFLDQLGGKVADIMELTPRGYRQYSETVFLIDDLALAHKVGQFAAVFPGLGIYKSNSGRAGRSLDVVKRIALKNQRSYLTVKKENPEYIVRWIDVQISEKDTLSINESSLRSGRLNSVIMKKMLRSADS